MHFIPLSFLFFFWRGGGGGGVGSGLVVNTSDSGDALLINTSVSRSRGQGFKPHLGRRVVSFVYTICQNHLSENLSSCNEKRDNKQCLLDTPRRVTVNNKRLFSLIKM